MTRARDIANNWAADITAVSAGVGITGGGTSGAVTVTNEMATTIDAKGDLVVGSGADAFTRLAAGTNEQRLVADSATTSGLAYVADTTNYAIGAKGDLLVGTAADTLINVPVGTNNQVLTADSATTSGVKWATADALPSQTGNSGKYLTTNGTTASWGAVSNLFPWVKRKGATTSGRDIRTISYNGSNLYVAAGGNGTLFTSPDGITWTSRTSGFGTNAINMVRYGNGLWVAVGASGTITTSTDGITWTARTSNMGTNAIFAVNYGGGRWHAVGSGAAGGTGGITSSTDGITWTRATTTNAGSDVYGIAYGNGYWVAGTNFSTNNLYISSNGTTWTAANTGSSAKAHKVFYSNSSFYTIPAGNDSAIYRSTAAPYTSWSYVGNFGVTQYFDSADVIQDYNNEFWGIQNPPSSYNQGAYSFYNLVSFPYPTGTGNDAYVEEYKMRAFAPMMNAQGGAFMTALYINSTGFALIGDSQGRIQSAQF